MQVQGFGEECDFEFDLVTFVDLLVEIQNQSAARCNCLAITWSSIDLENRKERTIE